MHPHPVQTAAPSAFTIASRRSVGRARVAVVPTVGTGCLALDRRWTWMQTLRAKALHNGGGLRDRIEVRPD